MSAPFLLTDSLIEKCKQVADVDDDSTDKELELDETDLNDMPVDKRWRRRTLKAESWSTTLCSKFIANVSAVLHTAFNPF